MTPPKNQKKIRINKYLARSGLGSRRSVEKIIKSGSVSVNKRTISDLSYQVDPLKDKVAVDRKEIKLPELKYYALNKPKGYVVTKSDPYATKTIFSLLPQDNTLFSVGRLDKETSGLIIITNDGDFAQRIIHPSNKVEKEYEVITKNKISERQIEALSKTINLNDGPTKLTGIDLVGDKKIIVKIEEGRKRIIRRIFKKIGNEVEELRRLRIGNIKLGALKVGEFRTLTEKEVQNA